MLVSGCDPGGREVESLPARHFSVRSLFFSPIANAELWKLVSLCRDDHLPRVRRYLGPLIMLPMPEVVFVQASEYASQAAQTGHKHSQDQRLQHCCHSAGTALSVAAQRQGRCADGTKGDARCTVPERQEAGGGKSAQLRTDHGSGHDGV